MIRELAASVRPEMSIIVKMGHNLLDPEDVVKKGNGGKAVTTLMQWKKVGGFELVLDPAPTRSTAPC